MAFGGYDGSIIISSKIDESGFNTGIANLSAGLGKIKSAMAGFAAAVGIAFSVAAVVSFGKSAVNAASTMSSSLTGLKFLMDAQGRSFANAKKFIDDYVSDGLVPATNAIAAYKNLVSRGYDTSQIETILTVMKDTATYNRQASYTMGEAIQTASEGLKNENSILVDNVGITTNVAKMWDKFAKSIGTTANNLTLAQKRQAEVNGFMEEGKYFTGAAASYADTYAGKIAALSTSFLNLKVAIGDSIIPIISAVLPYIKAAVDALTVFFNRVAAIMRVLFNAQESDSVAGLEALTNNTNAAAAAQDNLADSTKKAGEAAKGALAGFDELNVLQMDSGSDASPEDAGSGAGGLDSGLTKGTDNAGGALDELKAKVEAFKASVLSALAPVTTSLQGLMEALQPFKDFVATGAKDFYENFLKPVGSWVLGEGLPRFIDAITNGLEKVNWDNINQSLNNLWDSLTPFAIHVGEGLLWFWENVLVPLGTWVVNDAVPVFLDLLSSAIDVVNSAIDALKPLGQWLFDNFLKPIAEWTGGVVIGALGDLAKALKGISDWIDKNQQAVRDITVTIAGFFAAWKIYDLITSLPIAIDNLVRWSATLITNAGAWITNTAAKAGNAAVYTAVLASEFADTISNLARSAAALGIETGKWIASTAAKIAANVAQLALNIAVGAWNVIGVVAAAVTTAFGAAVAFLTSPIGLVVLAIAGLIAIIVLLITHWDWVSEQGQKAWAWIQQAWKDAGDWFKNTVLDPIVKWFNQAGENIGKWASDTWEKIQNFWNGAGEWFKNTVTEPIKSGFNDSVEKIKQYFSDGWQFIQDTWNGAITWFQEKVTDPIQSGFDTALKSIKEGWETTFNGIRDFVKGIINTIIDFINGMISAVAGGINSVIRSVNSIHVTVPSWVPGFGGQSWGVSIPSVSAPQIPRLATGAVIPANSEFLAVLGDQRSGTNIEAPADLIRQIIREEIQGANDTLTVEMPVYLDSEKIYQGQKKVQRRRGTSLITGGSIA
jgi:hypothetical protein